MKVLSGSARANLGPLERPLFCVSSLERSVPRSSDPDTVSGCYILAKIWPIDRTGGFWILGKFWVFLGFSSTHFLCGLRLIMKALKALSLSKIKDN